MPGRRPAARWRFPPWSGAALRVLLLASIAAISPGTARAQAGVAQRDVTNQPPPGGRLSLQDAIAMAASSSEQVRVAQAGVNRAEGERVRARAELFPQLAGSVSYDRTLASEFSGIFGASAGPPCDPFTALPEASVGERLAEIERAISCGAVGADPFGAGDVDLPFGQRNIYRLDLSFSQSLYTGGRVPAQRAVARAGQDLARVGLSSARAQVVLDATEAYYDAALSDRLLAIAEAALAQATATLQQVELSFEAGRLAEFEVLRARVARDNQRPVVVRTRAQRTLAYLRLRQLLHLTEGGDLVVEANLDDAVLPPPAPFDASLAESVAPQRAIDAAARVAVRQAEAGVAAREAGLRIVRSQRLPSVSFNSAYGRVAYAGLPSFSDVRTNWTVGVFAQLPILTGGRIRGDQLVAAADLAEARAQRDQAFHLTEVDTRAAFEELEASRTVWEASAGTVEQAARAYDIAQLRYREGISTQLELSDARFLLEQAQANRAQAARDLQVARVRIALLPDLPLGTTGLATMRASATTSTLPVAGSAFGSVVAPSQGPVQGIQGIGTSAATPGGIRQ